MARRRWRRSVGAGGVRLRRRLRAAARVTQWRAGCVRAWIARRPGAGGNRCACCGSGPLSRSWMAKLPSHIAGPFDRPSQPSGWPQTLHRWASSSLSAATPQCPASESASRTSTQQPRGTRPQPSTRHLLVNRVVPHEDRGKSSRTPSGACLPSPLHFILELLIDLCNEL